MTVPLREAGFAVDTSDVADYGFPRTWDGNILDGAFPPGVKGIITNPPFNLALQFIEAAIAHIPYSAWLLRTNFLESVERLSFFEKHPPARVWISSRRLPMMHRWGWDGKKAASNHCYAWFVWDEGSPDRCWLNWFDWERVSPPYIKGQTFHALTPYPTETLGFRQGINSLKLPVHSLESSRETDAAAVGPFWAPLPASALAAVHAAQFRISGAAVIADGLDNLTDEDRLAIDRAIENGSLWRYFGGEKADREAIEFLEKFDPPVEAVLVEDPAEVPSLLERVTVEANGRPIGIDIETTGGDRPWLNVKKDGTLAVRQAKLDGTALAPHRGGEIATLQLHGGGSACWVFHRAALQAVLQSGWLQQRHMVGHNSLFESTFLAAAGVQCDRLECTMLGASLLLGKLKISLADTSLEYLRLDPPKELQLSDWGAAELTRGQICYAACDSILVFRLWPLVEAQLHEKGRWAPYAIDRDAIPGTTEMQVYGAEWDGEEHERQLVQYKTELREAEECFFMYHGIVPPNRERVRDWLGEYLPTIGQYHRWPRTWKDHVLSTKKGHLMRLVHRLHVPAAEQLLVALDMRKMLSSFGENYASEHVHGGRIYPRYNIGGTRTGRFSAEDPNIQQLPVRRSHLRRCVIARSGYIFIEADYSQIELRGCAEVADLPAMRQVYFDGRDLHTETAELVHGRPIGKNDLERGQAKTINFLTIYYGKPPGLVYAVFRDSGIVITEERAAEYQEALFTICDGLKAWMERQIKECRQLGYVQIGSGRIIESRWQPDHELRDAQAVNYPTQGACGECAKRALARLYRRIRTEGLQDLIRIVNVVHDSIMLETLEAYAKRAAVLLEEEMLAAFVETFPKASTRGLIEIKVGPNWGDMEELKKDDSAS